MVAARLTRDDGLLVNGDIDTRLPLVTNGLVAHYPFDGTVKGISNSRIIDYDKWTVGTNGGQTGFGQNGDGNSIISGVDPFGGTTAIWRTLGNDIASDADGGWETTAVPIVSTKLYRFSVWIKCKVLGDGRYYFGCYGYGGTNGVTLNSSSAWNANTNPYFTTGEWSLPLDEWYLMVAFVHPHNTTAYGNHIDSGWYAPLSTTKVSGSMDDFRCHSSSTSVAHRTYLYYSTLATTDQQWCYPRIDLCDGSEPTIADLVNGEGNVVNPITNTGTVITNDGIAIEKATTNMIQLITANFTPWAGMTGRSNNYVTLNGTRGVTVITDNDGGALWYGATTIMSCTASTKYTISAKVKYLNGIPSDNLMYIREYNNGTQTTEVGYYGVANKINIGDGWQRVTVTFTTGASVNSFQLQGYEYAKNVIFIEDVQIELGDIATEYIPSSKSIAYLNLIVPLSTTNTISFDYLCKSNKSVTVLSNGSYNAWWGIFITNLSQLYMHEASSGGSFVSNYIVPLNEWIHITIVWTISNQYLYVDGVLLGSVATNMSVGVNNIPIIYLGTGWNHGDGIFKNVSIYNSALSVAEITKLTKGTHSITKTGLLTNSVATRSDSEGTRFNFDSDGMDYNKYIVPTTDVNTVYDDGVWIGGATTNLLTNTFINSNDALGRCIKIDMGNDIYRYINNGTGESVIRLFCNLASLTNGSTYSARLQYSDLIGTLTMDWCDVGITYIVGCGPTDNSGLLVGKAARATYDNTYRFLDVNLTAGSSVTLHSPQVELAYPSPFTNGTRGVSDLHLPYNIIDCKSDFTIYGWMKPATSGYDYQPFISRGVANGNTNGRRILVMAQINRKFRVWFGSAGSEATFEQSTVQIRENEWTFICLSRTGANINLYVGNANGYGKASMAIGTYLNTDNDTHVWEIGTWYTSISNAYHKDYSFIQRGLSDTEVNDIFKLKMRASVDGLLIQNISSINTL